MTKQETAVLKEEFKDKESTPQWISMVDEDHDHFISRIIAGGSDPNHYTFESG